MFLYQNGQRLDPARLGMHRLRVERSQRRMRTHDDLVRSNCDQRAAGHRVMRHEHCDPRFAITNGAGNLCRREHQTARCMQSYIKRNLIVGQANGPSTSSESFTSSARSNWPIFRVRIASIMHCRSSACSADSMKNSQKDQARTCSGTSRVSTSHEVEPKNPFVGVAWRQWGVGRVATVARGKSGNEAADMTHHAIDPTAVGINRSVVACSTCIRNHRPANTTPGMTKKNGIE